jgi:hypothetical protein
MARKHKKQSKHPSSGLAKLKRDLVRQGLKVDTTGPLPGAPKLSAALIELVAPFAPYAKTLREYRTLISIGVTAWNLPVLKGKEHEAFYTQVIQPLLDSGSKGLSREAHYIFDTLLKRRERDFADDKRLVVSYTVTDNGDEYNVAVATVGSGPAKRPAPNADEAFE